MTERPRALSKNSLELTSMEEEERRESMTALAERDAEVAETKKEPKWMSGMKLAACFAVIQVNGTLFGLVRERILVQHEFPTPLFLVGAAQLASLLAAALICAIRRHSYARERQVGFWARAKGIRRVPLLQFALMALSDSIGRSVQIEARRASNVAFSFRLFVQSSKVLSVMAVGNLLQSFAQSSRQVEKPYSRRDFRDASLVALGLFVFVRSARVEGQPWSQRLDGPSSLDSAASASGAASSGFSSDTTPGGLVLLLAYTACDAFTWQWQARLYREFAVDQYTVMLWLNACHLVVVLSVLAFSGDGLRAALFLVNSPPCAVLVAYLAALAASSQLVVLYVIRRFGPVTFTLLMSGRQLVALTLSGFACALQGGFAATANTAAALSAQAAGPAAAAAAAGVRARCAPLRMTLLRPIPILSAVVTWALLTINALRAKPLAIEMRSFPTEIDVS